MKKHRRPKKIDDVDTVEKKPRGATTEVEARDDAPPPADWFTRWFGLEPIRVEEFRDGESLVVRADMPGLDPDDDVEISVGDHTLRIRAERRQESKVEEKDGYRTELRYGFFTRSVPLPAGAVDDDVKGTYKDGVLEVRVRIDPERADARKVTVQRV
jgi:HSP20 family protein